MIRIAWSPPSARWSRSASGSAGTCSRVAVSDRRSTATSIRSRSARCSSTARCSTRRRRWRSGCMAPFAAATDPIVGAKLGAALGGALIAVPGVRRRRAARQGPRRRAGRGGARGARARASAYLVDRVRQARASGSPSRSPRCGCVLRALERPTRGRARRRRHRDRRARCSRTRWPPRSCVIVASRPRSPRRAAAARSAAAG